MAAEESPTSRFDDEIAEIENRSGNRRLFMILGGLIAAILLFIMIFGGREQMRLRAEAARPRTEPVTLGRYIGSAGNQAVFAREHALVYVEGLGSVDVGPATTFARKLEYDLEGNPIPLTGEILYWRAVQTDSLPYVVEPLANPLLGINPAQYETIQLGALRAADYSAGGPHDWRPHEEDRVPVAVSGVASREGSALVLTDGPARVRVQGIEGLSAIDSLELDWATSNQERLTAYGRISSTPRGGDVLFVMTAEGVHPPEPETAAAAQPETAAPASPAAPPAPGQEGGGGT